MGTTLAKIIMSKTFVIVLACLVAAAVAQETMIMSDFNLLRSVANATGAAKTLPASPIDVKDSAGLVGFSLSADGKTLYGANVNTNKVLAFDLSKDTISYSVLAGSDTAPTAINTTLNENSGTSVQFMSISDMAMGADGNLYVLDSGFGVIRKVTPAGVATHFAGASFASDMWTANAAGDGVATVAGFTADKLTQIAASSTGIFMIVDNGVLKEVAADGTVTTKSGATASPGVNGVGTSASFDVINDMKFSADGNSLYVAEAKIATPNLVEGAFGDAANVVRKVDMSNFGVSTLAGNVPTAAGSSADGTGTSVFFSAISSLSVSSAGDVFATEVCNTGSVVRKISPDGTTATHAGDLNTAGCKQPKVVTDFTALKFNKDGMGTSAGFNYVYDSAMVQEVCGKFFPIGADAELDDCDDLSGTVKQVKAKGPLKIKKALIIQSLFVILAGGSVQADAPITVEGPLEVAGNGTMEINDNDVVCDEVTLSNEGTYQILVARAVPASSSRRALPASRVPLTRSSLSRCAPALPAPSSRTLAPPTPTSPALAPRARPPVSPPPALTTTTRSPSLLPSSLSRPSSSPSPSPSTLPLPAASPPLARRRTMPLLPPPTVPPRARTSSLSPARLPPPTSSTTSTNSSVHHSLDPK